MGPWLGLLNAYTVNRQKFTVKKSLRIAKTANINARKFSIEYIAIHSYPVSANIF